MKTAKLLNEIDKLKYTLENTSLSHQDRQRIIDEISDKKREIEKISKSEPLIIPSSGPKVSERKRERKSIYNGNSVRL